MQTSIFRSSNCISKCALWSAAVSVICLMYFTFPSVDHLRREKDNPVWVVLHLAVIYWLQDETTSHVVNADHSGIGIRETFRCDTDKIQIDLLSSVEQVQRNRVFLETCNVDQKDDL